MASEPDIVLRTPWFEIERIEAPELGEHPTLPFYRMNSNDGVMILPITCDQRIILVKQYRPAIGGFTVELPAGGVEMGERPLDGAIRELMEETGHASEKISLMISGRVMSGRLKSMQHIFIAEKCIKMENYRTESGIQVIYKDLDQIKKEILLGKISQLTILSAIQVAQWLNFDIS